MTYFLSTEKAGKGIHLEITLILLLSGFYVLFKSRSLWRSVATALSLYVLVAIVSTPRLYLPLPSLKETSLFESRHIIYLLFYFVEATLLGAIFLWRLNRNFPRALFQALSSFRTLHFLLMVGIGVFFNPVLELFRIPDSIYFMIATIVMIFLWLATLLVNDVYDLKIDTISNPQRPLVSGLISPVEYLNLGFCLFLLALYASLVLGVISYVIALMIVFSGVCYSVPPLRIRNRMFHNLFIGWGSVLAFLFGYFIQADISHLSLSGEVMMLVLLIFLALSAGSVTKDLKDYEGDRQSGVKTIFTVCGLKKGMRISSVLLGLSLLTPLLLFHRLLDFFVLGLIALIIPILFAKFKQLPIAFLGYGIAFVYCVFKHFVLG
jgi:4-hydroxybenzoate polyprenyltransferase